MIPSEPTTMRMSAWQMRSELTTAPIVVRLRCSAIGPSSSWSATATSPSLPSVGILVLPVGAAGDAEGPGDAPGEPDGAGEPDGDADGAGDADGLPLGAALRARRGRGSGTRAAATRSRSASDAPGLADGLGLLEVGQLLGLDLDEVGAGLDRDRLEALLGEDRLDLVGRDIRVLEADLPARPAGVVDRELEARVGERRQEDEDEARDGDDQGEDDRTSAASR